jgi:RND family efflux transporter MFP subunit
MERKLPVMLICVCLLVVLLLKLVANKNKLDEKNKPAQEIAIRIPVNITTVSEEIRTIELIRTGILAPYKEVKLLSAGNGNIRRLLFEPGDKVVRGQPLAIIDTRLLAFDLARAESTTAKLQRDLQTYTELLEGKAATEQKVNEIRQLYMDAQNRELQLRKQIADATIRAPATGIISSKDVEEGMYVSTGGAIGSIINQSQLKVKVYVTELQVYRIRLGEKIKLTTAVYPDNPFWGIVTFISPNANQAHNYEVEITAAGGDSNLPLRPGTFVEADFSGRTSHKILVVPREALNESTEDAFVYVAESGRARLRKVKAGATYGSNVQITDGLQPGDQVVTSGQINLKDGSFVKVSK